MPHTVSPPILAMLAAFCLPSSLIQNCSAQSPTPAYLYRWSFEAGGLPESEFAQGVKGGELTIGGGGMENAPLFQKTGGISPLGPGVLNASRGTYGDPNGAQINSFGSPLRAAKTSGRFTITMWVKASLPPQQQPEARLLSICSPGKEQGPQSIFITVDRDTLGFTVGGSGYYALDVSEPPLKVGEWRFLVFCYDGVATNPYYCPEMSEAVQCSWNGAVLVGDPDQPTRLINKTSINTGAPTYTVPPGPVTFDGQLVAIGSSNGAYDRSFVGWIDDVRIYDGLLSLAQIERVRLESLGK